MLSQAGALETPAGGPGGVQQLAPPGQVSGGHLLDARECVDLI
jgi:hypothetical protein